MTASLICGFVGLFNAIVDPYGTVGWVRISGFNSEKPAQQTRVRLVKAAEIRRVKPTAIVLGTSRSHIGLRMNHPGWKGEPRYNAAFDGATLEEIHAYLLHAQAMAPLREVVLGIDTWQLEENPAAVRPDFDAGALARPDDPWSGLQEALSDLRLLFSVDTVVASISTLRRQGDGEPQWFAPDGQRLGPQFFRRTGEEYETMGPRAYFLAVDRQEIGFKDPRTENASDSAPASQAANINSFEFMRKIVVFCRERAIDLRIFITPAHAHQIEIAAAMGEWSRIDKGKRDLVRLLTMDAREHGTPPVPLWDFSGDSSVTEEPLPSGLHNPEMRFYWDSSHFKEEVGDWILDRLFGTIRSGHEIPEDFGQRLTSENVNAVLAGQHRQHARYAQAHYADIDFIRRAIEKHRS